MHLTKADLDRMFRRISRKLGPMDDETRIWGRAYRMAVKEYPTDIRACRIFAWAYTRGFLNAKKQRVNIKRLHRKL